MRLWLVIAFAAAIIGSGVIDIASSGGRFDLASKSQGVAMLAEVAEEGLAEPRDQTLSINFLSAITGSKTGADPTASLNSRQTNRHLQRNELYCLHLAFLI